MKTKKNLLITLLLLSSQFIISQTGYDFQYKSLDIDESINRDKNGNGINMSEVVGSPYLNDEFTNGYIINLTTNMKTALSMRYNIYNDEIELINTANNTIGALKKDKKFEIYIGQNKFILIDSDYYEELLSENKGYGLLIKHKSNYIAEKPAATPLQQGTKAKFKNKELFLLIKDSYLVIIPINKKKKIIELFSDKKNQVKTYINTNNLNLKKQRDLLRIVTYYNSLLG